MSQYGRRRIVAGEKKLTERGNSKYFVGLEDACNGTGSARGI